MPSLASSTSTLLLAFLMLPLGPCRTQRDVQVDIGRKLRPAELAPTAAPSDEAARPIRVRAFADEDYRAEIVRWRERIDDQIARANGMLEPQFGVRLVLEAIQPWARSGRTGTLTSAIEALAAMDDGADGAYVVGFVSFSGAITGTMEHLGMARMFGRHLVVRNLVSFEEAESFRRGLFKLSDAERTELLREREQHREAVVLLHEWAHTLGAFHERDPDSILSPRYGTGAGAFSRTSARVIELGLARTAPPGPVDGAGWARAYRAEVERASGEAFDSATVEAVLAAADGLERDPPCASPPP